MPRTKVLGTATLEAIHARVAHALEDATEQLHLAQEAELALRNYEAARKHDFNVTDCQRTLEESLAAIPERPE